MADGIEAARRAESIPASLIVRPNRSGQPVWSAVWRDSGKRSMNRTIGKAWLRPRPPLRNPFIEGSEGRESKDEPRGQASWRHRWEKRPGRPKDGALDERRAQAEARALVLAREVEIEREREAQEGGPRTFAEVADAWLMEKAAEAQDGALKASTLRDYQSMLRRPDEPLKRRGRGRRAWLMRAYGSRAIRSITADDIDALDRRLRAHGLAPQTRRKYGAVLAMIFAYAQEKGWTDDNPVVGKGRQKRKRRKREKLPEVYAMETVEQIARKVEDTMLGEVVRLAALTGLRQGELLALRWRDVDFTGQRIVVRARYVPGEEEEDVPKGGKVRTVPLSDQAAVVLDRVSRREKWTKRGDLVFPNEKGDNTDPSTLRRAYMKARDIAIAEAEKAGDPLPVVVFHGLRHTFGTRCAMKGVPMFTLQHWMGHADAATTAIYAHWSPQADDAARLSAAFAEGTPREVEGVAQEPRPIEASA